MRPLFFSYHSIAWWFGQSQPCCRHLRDLFVVYTYPCEPGIVPTNLVLVSASVVEQARAALVYVVPRVVQADQMK